LKHDREAIQNRLEIDQMRIVEGLVTVQILVGRQLAIGHESEDGREEVLRAIDRRDGIIKRSVFVLQHVQLAVDDAHPAGVAHLLRQLIVEVLGTDGKLGQIAVAVILSVTFAATPHLWRSARGPSAVFLRLHGGGEHHPNAREER